MRFEAWSMPFTLCWSRPMFQSFTAGRYVSAGRDSLSKYILNDEWAGTRDDRSVFGAPAAVGLKYYANAAKW